MAVRSIRFFGPAEFGSGTWAVYTVPAGRTALVKAIYVSHLGLIGDAGFSYGIEGVGSNQRLEGGFTIQPAESLYLERWFVAEAGDDIWIGVSVSNLQVSMHGALLLGEA